MDNSYDCPATQVCDNHDVEPSQNFAGSQKTKKTPVGVLTINNDKHIIYIGTTTIGRFVRNDIVIKDTSISKHHAEIEAHRNRVFVTDLKSLNGTTESKVKFIPNRAYELVDGALIKFGNVVGTFRKLSTLNKSISRTPSVPKFNEIIASTPDSTLNTSHDDSSVVYGTQAAQQSKKFDSSGVHDMETSDKIFDEPTQSFTTKSPIVKKTMTPKNLMMEYSKEENTNNTNHNELHEKETQQFSSPSVKKVVKAKNLQNENSTVEQDSTKSDVIHEAETQAVLFKSPLQKMSKIQHSFGEDLFSDISHNAESSSGKIFEEATQEFQTAKKSSKSFEDKNIIPDSDEEEENNLEDSDTDEEGIFDQETQKIPVKSAKIHEETTQIFQSTNAPRVVIDDEIFDKPTQIIPTKLDVIPKKKQPPMCRTSTPKVQKYSKSADSDEDKILEGVTQIFSAAEEAIVNLDGPTQKFSTSDKVDHSSTNESIDFDGPTQKLAVKTDDNYEAETQVYQFTKAGKLMKITDNLPGTSENEINLEGPTQKISTVDEEETQVFKCPKNLEKSDDSDTDEEGIFEGPTQKISTDKNNIHEVETQAITSTKSPEDEEINFEGPTQKIATNDNNIHEIETQAILSRELDKEDSETDEEGNFDQVAQKNENNIHEKKTQAFTGKELEKHDSETDEEGIFEGPTQKIPAKENGVYEEETEAFPLEKDENISKNENLADSKISENENLDNISNLETVEPISKVLENENIVPDSETDDEGNFENETKKCAGNTSKNDSNLTKNSPDNKEIDKNDTNPSVDDSKPKNDNLLSPKSKNTKKTKNIQKTENISENLLNNSESEIFSKSNSQIASTSKTIAPSDSKILEDSDSEVESILKSKNSETKVENSPRGRNLRSSAQANLKPLEDNFAKVNSKLIKRTKKKPPSPQDSETDEETSQKVEKTPRGKRRISLIQKKNENLNSPSIENDLSSRFASIENIEYETATTQPIDDIKTPKSKKKSSMKNSAGPESSKVNDTIEANLHTMFDGSSEDLEEPSRMLTQQLQNILEQSQVPEEPQPTTSRSRISRKIEKSSPSLSEKSFKVDADKYSPRMSQLNIIRTKRSSTETTKKEREVKNDTSDAKSMGNKTPLKKRPLRMTNDSNSSPDLTPSPEKITKKGKNLTKMRIDKNEPSPVNETKVQEKSTRITRSQETKNSQEREMKKPQETKLKRGRAKKQKEDISTASESEEKMPTKPKRGRQKKEDISVKENSTASESEEKLPIKPKRGRAKKVDLSESKKIQVLVTRDDESEKDDERENEVKGKKEVKTTRNKRQTSVKKDIASNTSSSSSFVDNSVNESSLSTTNGLKTEPKKPRGRKRKNTNDTENSKLENTVGSSSTLSLPESDANLSASSPLRSKRSRFSSPVKHKVLFTGLAVKDYQKHLTKLGLSDTDDVKKCTVLVTDKVRRTFKFLCALSQGIPIVSDNWIKDSAKKSNIQDLDKYIVKDPAAESKYKFKLSESLQKARDKKMLAGYTLLFTPNLVAPPASELKEMAVACGGKGILRPPAKWANNTIVVSEDADLDNAKKFMAKAPKSVTLHSCEFLLTGILKQEVDLQSYILSVN